VTTRFVFGREDWAEVGGEHLQEPAVNWWRGLGRGGGGEETRASVRYVTQCTQSGRRCYGVGC
jgi:hypothetical protein